MIDYKKWLIRYAGGNTNLLKDKLIWIRLNEMGDIQNLILCNIRYKETNSILF